MKKTDLVRVVESTLKRSRQEIKDEWSSMKRGSFAAKSGTKRYTNTAMKTGTITESAVSTRIVALNLPVKQTNSHWTIRSSLIDNSQYLSTHGLSPVIAVVDKSYSRSVTLQR